MSSKCADLRRPVAGGHSRTPFGYLGVKLSIPTVDGGRGADAVSTAHRRDLFWASSEWKGQAPCSKDFRHVVSVRWRASEPMRGAIGNSVLTVVYHLLSNVDLDFCELGPGHYESRINKHRRARDLATQLQALTGQHIDIRDGKAIITDNAA